jgi:hypothetical protein
MCEHEGLFLLHKDQFVITPYLYSYQVQPLETVWQTHDLNLHDLHPRVRYGG